MKKNRKGFMLAELIITSTIVVTTMVALYANFNRVYSLYEKKKNYYSIDGIYASKKVIKELIKSPNTDFNYFVNNKLDESHYTYIIEDNQVKLDTSSDLYNKINEIKELYNIENMILSEYDKCILSKDQCQLTTGADLKNNVENETLKEYIDHVINYYDIKENDTNSSYIVITEIKIGNENYYANLRIR